MYKIITIKELFNSLLFFLKKLNISDIEPWSIYKISGDWLFELERLLNANNE